MKVYLYDSETFQFNGAVEICKNPEEPDKWLMPAFSTTIVPDKNSNYECLFWDDDNQQWYEKNNNQVEKEKYQEIDLCLLYNNLLYAYERAKKYPLYIGNFNNKDKFISVDLRDKLALLANTFITFADTIDLELNNEKITLSKNEFMSILAIVHKRYEQLYWKYKDMKNELSQITELTDNLYEEYRQKIDNLFKDNI